MLVWACASAAGLAAQPLSYYQIKSQSIQENKALDLLIIGDLHVSGDRAHNDSLLVESIKNGARKNTDFRALVEAHAEGRKVVFLFEGASVFEQGKASELMQAFYLHALEDYVRENSIEVRGWDSPPISMIIVSFINKMSEWLNLPNSSPMMEAVFLSALPMLVYEYRNFVAIRSVEKMLDFYKSEGVLLVMFMGVGHVDNLDLLTELKNKNINYKTYVAEYAEKHIQAETRTLPSGRLALSAECQKYFNYSFINKIVIPALKSYPVPTEKWAQVELQDALDGVDQVQDYLLRYGKISKENLGCSEFF